MTGIYKIKNSNHYYCKFVVLKHICILGYYDNPRRAELAKLLFKHFCKEYKPWEIPTKNISTDAI